jgi:single-strand DNA-binding protein
MSGINRWQGWCRIGADPELRFTQGGTAVLNLRLACTEKFKPSGSNEEKEITAWINGVIWNKRGEALAKILTKGQAIYVEGPLRTSSYEDKDGNKKYKTEVEIREIEFAGGGRREDGDSDDRGARGRDAGDGGYGGGGYDG